MRPVGGPGTACQAGARTSTGVGCTIGDAAGARHSHWRGQPVRRLLQPGGILQNASAVPRRSLAILVPALAIALGACDAGSTTDAQPEALAEGTWGGDNTGVIIDEMIAHVHIGCTFGDFPAPVLLDADSRFNVTGQYLLRAYPVAIDRKSVV